MSFDHLTCPKCGESVKLYRNPIPTVDIIIETDGGVVLIARKNEPLGWALPGGFVDYGETLEAAAVREAREETSLEITDLRLLGCYSDPSRDPRQHTISTVFVAKAAGTLQAADDAADAVTVPLDAIPETLCFDHGKIIADYVSKRRSGLI
ncbi:MAG TPA: NUDIX hydrolase [Geobacteraceae bacterium]